MTNKVIIYPLADGTFAELFPTGVYSDVETARKDVPANTPYLIVDRSAFPTDYTFRDAWTADFSNPDGYGIGQDAWFQEKGMV